MFTQIFKKKVYPLQLKIIFIIDYFVIYLL